MAWIKYPTKRKQVYVPHTDPYRTPSPPPPEPVMKEPFSKRYPRVYNVFKQLGYFGVGIACLIGIVAAGWALTVGFFKLGMYVANDLLHWDFATTNPNNDNGYPMVGWLMGLLIVVVPIVAYLLGRGVITKSWRAPEAAE